MSRHVFVDETKQRGYLLVAAVVIAGDLATARKELRALVLPGQRALHMNAERDARRRAIADAIARMDVQAVVYDAGKRYKTDRNRRAACLDGLITDECRHTRSRITLEVDETLRSWDNQRLIELTRTAGARDRIEYTHATAAAELLLCVPDAIAWCWAKGGHWRDRVRPVVTGVREV